MPLSLFSILGPLYLMPYYQPIPIHLKPCMVQYSVLIKMAGTKFQILSCRVKPYVHGIAKACGAYDELDKSLPHI
jgi:hypothetical protein